MGQNYYPQSGFSHPATLTVSDLIERLAVLDPAAPVIFRSPEYGAFGSNTTYSIEKVEPVRLARSEQTYPGGIGFDEDTGEEYSYEGWTDVREAWSGVVIG